MLLLRSYLYKHDVQHVSPNFIHSHIDHTMTKDFNGFFTFYLIDQCGESHFRRKYTFCMLYIIIFEKKWLRMIGEMRWNHVKIAKKKPKTKCLWDMHLSLLESCNDNSFGRGKLKKHKWNFDAFFSENISPKYV